jgi:hypothetical protein
MPPQQRMIQPEDEKSISSESGHSRYSQTAQKRHITFNQRVEVFGIPHIRDMPRTQVTELWYQRSEYETMKQSFVPIIRSMMKCEFIAETNEQTTRGLEYRTRLGALARQANKVDSIRAVLDEQDKQFAAHENKPCKLRDIYLNMATHCSLAARELGKQDEEAMLTDYMEKTPWNDNESSCAFSCTDGNEDEVSLPACSTPDSTKKVNGLSKLFKQVRHRRRPIMDDMSSIASTRRVSQAA